MGGSLIGREEDGIERYHFVHHGEMATGWRKRTRRMEEKAGKVGERGERLRELIEYGG